MAERRPDRIRVLVVGAGIIGPICGWALAESGDRVARLVRSCRGSVLCDGLTLDILDRRKGHERNFRELYGLSSLGTLALKTPSKRGATVVFSPERFKALL
jgi:hypothetical protein